MKKIVCLSTDMNGFAYEQQIFADRGDAEFLISPARTKQDVVAAVKDADVILFTDITFDKALLDQLEKCKLIIRYGIGYDNIDTAYAKEKGIMVCNAPNYGVIDVAEHALSLLLSCAKRLPYMGSVMKDGKWFSADMGKSQRLYGKKVGFVGFGKIARCVCERTNALGMKALVYDPYVTAEALDMYHAQPVTLEELLKASDYITLHLPLTEQTQHMFGKAEFERMKPSAVLINTSRGKLVDEAALVQALADDVIAGAGLDVFEDETRDLDPRLLKMQQVTLTPHVAWNTVDGGIALHQEVTGNVVRFLEGERPESIVNGL